MDRIPGYWSHKNDASSIPTIVTLFLCGYQGLEIVRCLVAAIGRDANIQDVLAGRDPRIQHKPAEDLPSLVRCYAHRQATGCGNVVLSVGRSDYHDSHIIFHK